jgi:type II pantothenate kinase
VSSSSLFSNLAIFSGFVSTLIPLLLFRRQKRPVHGAVTSSAAAFFRLGRTNFLAKLLELAAPFSVDIGGSLTKLVFFVPDRELAQRVLKKCANSAEAEALQDRLGVIDRIAAFVLKSERYGRTGVRDSLLTLAVPDVGGTFHFIRFETRRMEGAMALAKKQGLNAGMHTICATGGGAHKFRELAISMLGVDLEARDEIACLVKGMAFLMANEGAGTKGFGPEAFTFEGQAIIDRPKDSGLEYPFLLANVGSGVSFIVVESELQWKRIGGTSLGGGTFYGLCHMLTGISEFDEMLDLAETGDNEKVDLTVGDIYGGDYPKIGLKASTIASSFGKAILLPIPPTRSISSRTYETPDRSRSSSVLPADHEKGGINSPSTIDLASSPNEYDGSYKSIKQGPRRSAVSFGSSSSSSSSSSSFSSATIIGEPPLSPSKVSSNGKARFESQDISRSILLMISNNIGQLAYLNAVQHKCKDVYFAGNFLRRENTIAMRTLAYSIRFWSKGTMDGLFLRHEGYCGALGAFLSTMELAANSEES